jgi:hypothetical protein
LQRRTSSGWKEGLADQVKITVLIEYLMNDYTFSLLVELLLQPVLALLALVPVVAKSKPEAKAAVRACELLMSLVGFTILGITIMRAIEAPAVTHQTFVAMALPVFLSAAIIPWIHFIEVCSAYEELVIRTGLGQNPTRRLRWYAVYRFFRHLGFNLWTVRAFLRVHGANLLRIRTKEDIDQLLRTQIES